MKNNYLSVLRMYLTTLFCCCSTLFSSIVFGQNSTVSFKGEIKDFSNSTIIVYKCYADTLLFLDSATTDQKGIFSFSLPADDKGLLNVKLRENQFFYIVNDGNPIEIKTIFRLNPEFNNATDSLEVLKSNENKNFYEFQRLQIKINMANGWLMQILRLYPSFDSFHQQVEKEYLERFVAMENLRKRLKKEDKKENKTSMTGLLIDAYYPFHPDWRQSDLWRDSVFAAHYFDYFNPAEELYLNTNILSEKIELYLYQKSHRADKEGKDYEDRAMLVVAAKEFLKRTADNEETLAFILEYVFRRLSTQRLDDDFVEIYDTYLKPIDEDCGEVLTTEINEYDTPMDKLRKKWFPKADGIRGVQVGHIAPDFSIKDTLNLHDIKSDYTILLFWSTWCPFCVEEIPKIKKITDKYEDKIKTVAISLDTDRTAWENFISEHNLFSLIHFSEFKSWKSDIVSLYNVHFTPNIFLLDKDKKIIGKYNNETELVEYLNKEQLNK